MKNSLLILLSIILCFSMCSTDFGKQSPSKTISTAKDSVTTSTRSLVKEQPSKTKSKRLTCSYKIYSPSQRNPFMGTWSVNGIDDGDDFMAYENISIDLDTSDFCVQDNQLGLFCKNVYYHDSLYLYVIETDQGRRFMGPKYYPPKPGSLFAICYIRNSTLCVIYTNRLFNKHKHDLELKDTLYKNSDKGIPYYSYEYSDSN